MKRKNNKNNLNKNLKQLWFLNLEGYESSSMQERHEFGLVVAGDSLEAKKLAKLNCY